MRYYGALFGEPLYVFGLTREERLWNQEWEVGVLCSRFLKHTVKLLLHLFPDGITIGFDNHTSSHGGLFRQVGFHNQVVKPLTIIVGTLG